MEGQSNRRLKIEAPSKRRIVFAENTRGRRRLNVQPPTRRIVTGERNAPATTTTTAATSATATTVAATKSSAAATVTTTKNTTAITTATTKPTTATTKITAPTTAAATKNTATSKSTAGTTTATIKSTPATTNITATKSTPATTATTKPTPTTATTKSTPTTTTTTATTKPTPTTTTTAAIKPTPATTTTTNNAVIIIPDNTASEDADYDARTLTSADLADPTIEGIPRAKKTASGRMQLPSVLHLDTEAFLAYVDDSDFRKVVADSKEASEAPSSNVSDTPEEIVKLAAILGDNWQEQLEEFDADVPPEGFSLDESELFDIDMCYLIVGDGDFSYTRAYIADLFEDAIDLGEPELPFDMTTSCLQTKEEVCRLHKNAAANIAYLEEHQVDIMYECDATKLHEDKFKGKFNSIHFNFPHIGGKSNIKKNRDLLHDYFNSGSKILKPQGRISVSLCKGQGGIPIEVVNRKWADSWQVVSMAADDLVLDSMQKFRAYNSYNSSGYRSQDKRFNTAGAFIYFFRFSTPLVKSVEAVYNMLKINARDKRETLMKVDGQIFVAEDRYIALRAKLNLLSEEGHPIKVEFNAACKFLSASFNISEKLLLNQADIIRPLLVSEEGDYSVKRGGVKYYFRANMEAQPMSNKDFVATIGAVYNYVPIGCRVSAVRHLFKFGLVNTDVAATKKKFISTIDQIMNRKHKHYELFLETEGNETRINVKLFSDEFSQSCNQISDTGKDLEEVTPAQKIFTAVTLITNEKEKSVLANFDLDVMTLIQLRSNDFRILWQTFKPDTRQNAMFPVKWRHDLSFWDNEDKVTERIVHDLIRNVADDLIDNVILMNIYPDPEAKDKKLPDRKAYCYREIYQSPIHPICHDIAHKIQNNIRCLLHHTNNIELR